MNKETLSFLFSLGVLGLFCILSVGYNKIECASISKAMQKNTQYNALTGCLIEYETGKWVPLQSYRIEGK